MRATKKKKDKADSTGQAPPNYTELDEIILDIIGKDSAAMQGLGQEDDGPSFTGPTNMSDSILNFTTQSIFDTGNNR
jgi:hypothetical protein